MLSPASKNNTAMSWGFGVVQTQFQGFLAFGHTGTGYGTRAISYVLPEVGLSFSATFNTRDANREKFLNTILTILIEDKIVEKDKRLPRKINKLISEIKDFQKSTIMIKLEPFKVSVYEESSESMREYAGTFHSDIAGKQEVKVSYNGNLVM